MTDKPETCIVDVSGCTFDLSRIESVTFANPTTSGIHWDSELAGPDGCMVALFPTENHTRDDIASAKAELRNARDVVSFNIFRVQESDLPPLHTDEPETGHWLHAIRHIVDTCQARRVTADGALVPKGKRGGQLVDLFSASIVAQVYDAVNAKNRAKMHAMSLPVAMHVALGVANKAST